MRRILVLLTLGIIASGCYSSKTLVGQWTTQSDAGNGTMTFRPDGTFHSESTSSLATLVLDGKYEFKGENLTMQMAAWDVKSKINIHAEDKKEMDAGLREPATMTVSFLDADKLKLMSATGQLTMANRAKK